MRLFKLFIGYSAFGFSLVGYLETILGLLKDGQYSLLKVLIYSLLFGIGMALVIR